MYTMRGSLETKPLLIFPTFQLLLEPTTAQRRNPQYVEFYFFFSFFHYEQKAKI